MNNENTHSPEVHEAQDQIKGGALVAAPNCPEADGGSEIKGGNNATVMPIEGRSAGRNAGSRGLGIVYASGQRCICSIAVAFPSSAIPPPDLPGSGACNHVAASRLADSALGHQLTGPAELPTKPLS